jgi:hypothetical protein
VPKPVAVEGDTQAETSTQKLKADSNQTGSWQLIKLEVMTGMKVSAGGKKVEVTAMASWMYAGGTTGSPPVPVPPVPDMAQLQGSSTILTDSGMAILLDGDEAAGSVDGDNKIVVTASQKILHTD